MSDKCFHPYCRKETTQCINGRETCDEHVEEAYELAIKGLAKASS